MLIEINKNKVSLGNVCIAGEKVIIDIETPFSMGVFTKDNYQNSKIRTFITGLSQSIDTNHGSEENISIINAMYRVRDSLVLMGLIQTTDFVLKESLDNIPVEYAYRISIDKDELVDNFKDLIAANTVFIKKKGYKIFYATTLAPALLTRLNSSLNCLVEIR